MTFCIITHVSHHQEQGQFFAYAPYVREMNLWFKQVDKVIVVAPLDKAQKTAIDIAYEHPTIIGIAVPAFNLLGWKQKLKTLFQLPLIFHRVYKAMKQADHIHLRCPGNMGLIGCVVQIFFPKKKKTAKYAGNWDPKAKQPWSYRIQKWILNNTLLTQNMQVLVYGHWQGASKNILPFFTATYHEAEKTAVQPKDFNQTLRFLFVGTLSKGKQPLYALQLVEQLYKQGLPVQLECYGDGAERPALEQYIQEKQLQEVVVLKGNQDKASVLAAYQTAHFLILASQSEGWPKVVAEAMFWGCLPLATAVSCVPDMLGQESRGLLLHENLEADAERIRQLVANPKIYSEKTAQAAAWSRTYTLEYFEQEIKKLVTTA